MKRERKKNNYARDTQLALYFVIVADGEARILGKKVAIRNRENPAYIYKFR